MGKIFEALYGSDDKKSEVVEEKIIRTEETVRQVVVSEESAPRTEYVEAPQETVSRYSAYSDLVTILKPKFSGNAKWRRDMRKVAINMMVQVDPNEEGGKVVMLTATSQGSGTSTVSSNLATILASEYTKRKVLLVDVVRGSSGGRRTLDAALDDGAQFSELFEVCEGDGVFRVVVSSTDDQGRSTEISHYIRALFAEAGQYFDWVIVDMPPVGTTPLADTVGRMADGVVLVVNGRPGSTRLPALNAMTDDMEQLGINVVGAVVNFRRYPLPRWLVKHL